MKNAEKNKFYEELVNEVKEDFLRRQKERRSLEQKWSLNLNYLSGNQYCEISPSGEVLEEQSDFYWQKRNVYNHIAPIIETRIAKLGRVRPIMSVRAAGSDESDLKTAKIASDVLNSTCSKIEFDSVISKVTLWSEVLGTAFYKVVWSAEEGRLIGEVSGEAVREGDVKIVAVSPFEIFPDSLSREGLEEVKSLIHARAMSVTDIESLYSVTIEGGDIDVFTLSPTRRLGGEKGYEGQTVPDSALVIERYEMPSKAHPKGRVVTIAADKLLAVGELPFINGVDGARGLPFVKQDSIIQPGSFFGCSVIERIIPLQRAYNAVKNRKLEFLNRVSVGVVAVEDGSIDADELCEEGLPPGKVIVYRQGSTPPRMMASQSVPPDFSGEEERLSSEFVTISGVSEISRNSSIPTTATSGVALQLLIEQDETRLSVVAENIRRAVKQVAKQIIRLFKQFATQTRMMKIAGEGRKAEVFYFSSKDITSDDVVFDTENELSYTPAQKKSAVYDLLATGILNEADGTMSERTKAKILEILGFGGIDNVRDLSSLHLSRAAAENLEFSKKLPSVESFDDHELHIAEHTRYLLSGEVSERNAKAKQNAVNHLEMHKSLLNSSSFSAAAAKGQDLLK